MSQSEIPIFLSSYHDRRGFHRELYFAHGSEVTVCGLLGDQCDSTKTEKWTATLVLLVVNDHRFIVSKFHLKLTKPRLKINSRIKLPMMEATKSNSIRIPFPELSSKSSPLLSLFSLVMQHDIMIYFQSCKYCLFYSNGYICCAKKIFPLYVIIVSYVIVESNR